MTTEEKITMVQAMTSETNEDIISAFLQIAGNKIIRKAYPFDSTQTEVPERYHDLQCEIAVYLLDKRGALGQTSHSENGISRNYEAGSVPDSMLDAVVPFIKAFGADEE